MTSKQFNFWGEELDEKTGIFGLNKLRSQMSIPQLVRMIERDMRKKYPTMQNVNGDYQFVRRFTNAGTMKLCDLAGCRIMKITRAKLKRLEA